MIPQGFAIDGYEDDYKAQERAILDTGRQCYLTSIQNDRW